MSFSIGVHKDHGNFYTEEIVLQFYIIYPSLHQNNLLNLSSQCLNLTSMEKSKAIFLKLMLTVK